MQMSLWKSQILFVFLSHPLSLLMVQEDEYEWGSSSILEALPSITSQQRRLALAAMRWRKALQGSSEDEVQTCFRRARNHPPSWCLRWTFSLKEHCCFSGSLRWMDCDAEHRPEQRIGLQTVAAVWRGKGSSLLFFYQPHPIIFSCYWRVKPANWSFFRHEISNNNAVSFKPKSKKNVCAVFRVVWLKKDRKKPGNLDLFIVFTWRHTWSDAAEEKRMGAVGR